MARKLALSAASLLGVLLVLELIVRLLGLGVHDFSFEKRKYAEVQILNEQGDYFYLPPNSSAFLWGSISTFNSLGMRDVEPPASKGPGTFRVLCLGDSVTAGEGVAQDLIFAYRLRALLADRGIEVAAGAVSGWNTLEEERFLRTNVDRLQPDLVVLLYVVNDNEPYNAIRRAMERSLNVTDKVVEAVALHSRLFEWSVFLWRKLEGPNFDQLRLLAQWNKEVKAAGPPFAPTDPGWMASRDALQRMRDLLAQRGARLVVILYDLGTFKTEPAALQRLREFGRDSGVPVFDTLPFFGGRKWQTLVNNPWVDPHPNAEGHALIAAGIARTLEDQALLPKRRNEVAAASQPAPK